MQNLKKEKLSDKIELLWANYEANHLEMLHAERELGKIHDNELRDKLQDLKIFEILQAEINSVVQTVYFHCHLRESVVVHPMILRPENQEAAME